VRLLNALIYEQIKNLTGKKKRAIQSGKPKRKMVLVYNGRRFIINGFNRKFITMPYSTCCGAHTNFEEIDICPDCLEHCDWEEEDEDEDEDTDAKIEQDKLNKL
jgi:hypothetical protein